MIQPIGFEKGVRKVYKLKKALYGLKQSPRLWYQHLSSILGDLGFKTLPFDEGVFIHHTKQLIIACHVDDLLVIGADKAVLFKVLKVAFIKIKLKELGLVTTFLGIEINLDLKKRELTLHQAKYTRSLLRRF